MSRIENATAHPGETERPLRDDELEVVNGGTIRALGGPDTGPQAAGKPQICIATTCYEWPL
jgi:hypothetical protein